MKHDLNYIAALEKAMKEQYGNKSIENPRGDWDPQKQKQLLEDSKELLKKEYAAESNVEKIDLDGVLIPKKLINRNNNKNCSVCNEYSFNKQDDVYLAKYTVCRICYVNHIEEREERWLSGWRPNGDK